MMRFTTILNKRTINLIALIVLLLLVGIWEFFQYIPGESVTWIPPRSNHTASISPLWVHENIFTDIKLQSLVVSLDNAVIVLGSDDINRKKTKVMAFSSDTGNELWQVDYDGSVITSTGSSIIVGGTREVIALNGNSGEILWRTKLQANVTRLVAKDNVLYVGGAASNHYHILDISTGSVLEKVTGSLSVWDYPVSGNMLYRKTGEGDVVAISQSNNQELWRSTVNGISNLVMAGSALYVLDENGRLLKLDLITGFSKEVVGFSPPPFLYSGENMGFEYSYYMAVDVNSNTLFVYLGDSSQLFAYNIK